jgi:hypothetical protein
MPERFDSGVFEPELAKLMKDAFANAWAKVHVAREDREAAYAPPVRAAAASGRRAARLGGSGQLVS